MTNNDKASEVSSSDIQAVSRVGQICSLFGPDTTELTAADVAERLGLNRTTAYRYCASLVTAEILDRGPRRGTFILGGLMMQLGIHALGRNRVVEIAPPYLEKLATAAHMTAVLSIWGAHGPVTAVVREDSTRTVFVTVKAGSQLDRTASQAHVFLAHQKDQTGFDRMVADASPSERADLEAAVYTARRTGHSFVSHAGGVFGVAVPVFDEHGICATVALLGAGEASSLSADSPAFAQLIDTAAVLSRELGGHEGQ
ncbi:IclR family transcriptional regulator [Leifsonia sp. Root112D2]|uniref:IclR family transcriptional regulator n=1 Tax=Leifsonia sp. Root112D2 TaxID=1736426 RepID=UPI0007015326|nr:helix-turn-helix domain-containing protein [Leifsonia sp. Root112D2]KQV08280.1 hypothetical protein ASC63_02840 [Leifsonia sp. Root112D2]